VHQAAVDPHPGSACVLAEMRRCGAPCLGPFEGESVEAYATTPSSTPRPSPGDPSRVVDVLTARITTLADAERYEDAAAQRDRLTAFVRAVAKLQRLAALTSVPELVAARPTADLGWELAVVRSGRLVAAGVVPRGARPGPYVDALVATAETVSLGPGPLPAATAEEVECVLRWLEAAGTRLVRLDGTWASPAYGARRHGAAGWRRRQDARQGPPVRRPPGACAVAQPQPASA
jgi:DNA polymerase-3 subunit epsilon